MRRSRVRPLQLAVALILAVGAHFVLLAAETGVQIVDSAWAKAMKANDLDAVMKCYAKDSVVWAPGEAEAKGPEAIRAMFGHLLDANTVKDASIYDGHYQTVGSRSVGWGKFSLTLQPKSGGSAVTMKGRFTEVGERRDGRWVYMVDHASADPPPSEAK